MTHKAQIIKTAQQHFMKYGYAATSTRDIAKSLNITQPALYHHFKNKEALYVAVLESFATQIGKSLHALAQTNESVSQRILTMSQFLQDKHPMNLTLMLNDIETNISSKAGKYVYALWMQNYMLPFQTVFEMLDKTLSNDLTSKQVTLHFLRILSVYIKSDKDDLQPHHLAEIVGIFLRGIQ